MATLNEILELHKAGKPADPLQYAKDTGVGVVDAEVREPLEAMTATFVRSEPWIPPEEEINLTPAHQRTYDGFINQVNIARKNADLAMSAGANKALAGIAKGLGLPEAVSRHLLSDAQFYESHLDKRETVGAPIRSFIADAIGAGGQSIVGSVAMSAVIPGSGLGFIFLSSSGNAYERYKDEGDNDGAALAKSLFVGGAEAAIEKLQLGRIIKGSSAAGFIQSLSEKAFKEARKRGGKLTKELARSAGENFMQEAVQEDLPEWLSSQPKEVGSRVMSAFKAGLGGLIVGPGATLVMGSLADAALPDVTPKTQDGPKGEIQKDTLDDGTEEFSGFETVADAQAFQDQLIKAAEEQGRDVEIEQNGTVVLLRDPTQTTPEQNQIKVSEDVKVEAGRLAKVQAEQAVQPVQKKQTPDGTPPLETQTVASTQADKQVIDNEVDGKPSFVGISSPRQDVIQQNREALGQVIRSKETQTFAQWEQEAVDQGLNRPIKARGIADEVIASERSMTPQESAGLTIAVKDIFVELRDVDNRLSELGDKEDTEGFGASRERLETEHDVLSEAMDISGSERGRALVSQKYAINLEGDIVALKARARKNKKSPLTKEENIALEDQVKALDEDKATLEKELAKLRAENADLVVKALIKQPSPTPVPKVDEIGSEEGGETQSASDVKRERRRFNKLIKDHPAYQSAIESIAEQSSKVGFASLYFVGPNFKGEVRDIQNLKGRITFDRSKSSANWEDAGFDNISEFLEEYSAWWRLKTSKKGLDEQAVEEARTLDPEVDLLASVRDLLDVGTSPDTINGVIDEFAIEFGIPDENRSAFHVDIGPEVDTGAKGATKTPRKKRQAKKAKEETLGDKVAEAQRLLAAGCAE